MSAISDAIAQLDASVDAAIERVQSDVTDLTTERDRLQAIIDSGGASADDIAALEATIAKINAIDPVKVDVLPEA